MGSVATSAPSAHPLSTGRPVPRPHGRQQGGEPDHALVAAAQAGDEGAYDALVARYRRVAAERARGYFVAGGDRDDLLQEALIGLVEAVRDYRAERGASFRAFAELCVSRQVVSAVRAATRRKHRPLNGAVPLTRTDAEDDGMPPLAGPSDDPATIAESAWLAGVLGRACDGALTPLEATVVRAHVSGLSYRETARMLGRGEKAVDNALQRARRKLMRHVGQA